MTQVVQQPWFWLILAWFILEVICLLCFRESWVIMTVKKLMEIIKHTVGEVRSEKARARFCGALLGVCLLTTLVPIVHGLNVAVTSADATPVILHCAVIALCIVGGSILAYRLNRSYVVLS